MNITSMLFWHILAQWRSPEWGMGPGMMYGGWGMGWFWGILMFAFWFAVMVIMFLLIRYLSLLIRDRGRGGKGEESALEILRRRYAKGEIGKEDFEEKRKDLGT